MGLSALGACWRVAVPLMVTGGYLADMPITLAAIDPCFSCTDRMISLDRGDGTADLRSWRELREYGIRFYRQERGIDLTELNRRFAKLEIE